MGDRCGTTSFFAPPDCWRENYVQLPEEEARHAAGVLRVETGTEIAVVDGAGGWFRVRVEEVGENRLAGRAIEHREEVGEPPYRLSLEMALLKKRSRLETLLEKAVELGVASIVPLRSRHVETDRFRSERARRVMIAALKQCRRSRLPELSSLRTLEAHLEDPPDGLRLVATQMKEGTEEGTAEDVPPLRRVLPEEVPERLRILIGPEGGLHEEEVAEARAAGYRPFHLGPRRLRGETAGIAAAAAVSTYYESPER